LPYFDYRCIPCTNVFEVFLKSGIDPEDNTVNCDKCNQLASYLPTFSGIADPIRIGVTRPPQQFIEGVLGRMEGSIPDGTVKGSDGRTRVNHVSFSKSRYSPGRGV
jgi:DNA-directed RNA polymerase subunit RPC12/RpoP